MGEHVEALSALCNGRDKAWILAVLLHWFVCPTVSIATTAKTADLEKTLLHWSWTDLRGNINLNHKKR